MNLRRSPDRSACPTVDATWVNCRMVPSICRSNTLPVGDDDDGVEGGFPIVFDSDELPCHPGDGVGLSATGRVLDQVFLSSAVYLGRSERSFRTTSSWWYLGHICRLFVF